MAETACWHFWVSGRVQGVFYRQSTCKKATELKLVGWVRNLKNGDVELLACGEINALAQLEQWLWQGPPAAKVQQVVKQREDILESYDDFRVIDNF